jgi:hypothetical protein
MMIGAASPLWGYFTGAAMAGVAFWWATRWMRPQDFEAGAEAMAAPALAFVAEEAADVEAAVEIMGEPALEAAAEAVGGPVAEALVGDELPMLPVGGEAGPFGAAVLEAELIENPALAAELVAEEEPPTVVEAAPAAAPRPRKPRAEGQPKPH